MSEDQTLAGEEHADIPVAKSNIERKTLCAPIDVVQICGVDGNATGTYSYGNAFPFTCAVDPVKGISSRRIAREMAKAQRRFAKRRPK